MKTIKNLISNIDETLDRIPNDFFQWFILLLCVGEVLLDFDVLLDAVIGKYGIPRLSTIINFVILPIVVALGVLKFSKKNPKVLIGFVLYVFVLLVYLVIHIVMANNMVVKLNLTNNFYFSTFSEIVYFLTITIPLFIVYIISNTKVNEALFEKVCITLSSITALPIFISNIFKFGLSTYTWEPTKDTFLSWYSLPFGLEVNHPREYACKFFFTEGNTIGILMFCVLPFVIYYIHKNKDQKIKKYLYSVLAFIHALSMMILGTRIGTYGAFLIPAMMLAIYLVMLIMKKENLHTFYVLVCIVIFSFSLFTYKYTPAYQNQMIGVKENNKLLSNQSNVSDDERNQIGNLLSKDYLMGDIEFKHSLIYAFEQYSWMINNTPEQYFLYYYNYKFDPAFWLDYAFNVPFVERVNGRQTQTYFQNYKWNLLNDTEKTFGMGYSTFMNGSIIIERDFVRQFYSFGYLGTILLVLPWFAILLYCGFKMLFNWKHWNMFDITLLASAALFYLSAYTSGHTIDQYITNIFLASVLGILINREKKYQK